MNSGIYIIISPTAKVYIGQSIDIEKRKNSYEKNPDKGQCKIYNSIKKYGFDKHLFDIVELCNESELNERERFWQEEFEVLNFYGLNLRLTETNDRSGRMSDETRKKMSALRKGKKQSPETIQKRIESRKNYTHSEETKRKIGNKNKIAKAGKKLSSEHRIRISKAKKGKHNHNQTEETKKKISEALKGNIPWNKGKKGIYSEETKRKLSERTKQYWKLKMQNL